MRLYVAGASLELLRLRREAEKLSLAGHLVTSRWLHTMSEGSWGWAAQLAIRFEDIAGSDAVVMYVPELDDPRAHTGGRHVEVGFGIALGKKIVIVGKPENIFERCATAVPSTEAAILLVLQ